jgi:hypothetical protein
MKDALSRSAPALGENPFRVLELSPSATPGDVEREGGRLLAMIAAGMDEPRSEGSLGAPPGRTAEMVRWAVAELRDPHKRAVHEFFWLSGTPLPVDGARADEVLQEVPLEIPGRQSVESLVQQFIGELVPLPKPWDPGPEVLRALDAALDLPIDSGVPPLVLDDMDLETLLELPRREEPIP